MHPDELELLQFHVTDIQSHVNAAAAQDLALSAKCSVSARTAEPFDGTLFLFMDLLVTSQSDALFRLEVHTETVMKLPDYKKTVGEEDAPACIALARRETHRAVRQITEAMGIAPLDLDTVVSGCFPS